MEKLSGIAYRILSKKLRDFGFVFFRQAKGSHEIWYNQDTMRYTTIPKHTGDMAEGTVRNILKQANIDVDDFIEI